MSRGIAYLRVSTDEQGASGLGLEAQEATVRALAAQHGVELVEPPAREVESGARQDRPVLLATLERCRREGLALLVARLDRLSRNAAHLLAIRDSGVRLLVGDLPVVDGPSGTLLAAVLAGVAQAERETISARTRAALAAARARGVRLGNPAPSASLARGRAAQGTRARQRAEHLRPLVEYLDREAGRTLAHGALAQALEAKRAPLPRGGSRWSYAQAARLRTLLAAS
jgi:DNA invertase Pin-like site-specific DNA recombinase